MSSLTIGNLINQFTYDKEDAPQLLGMLYKIENKIQIKHDDFIISSTQSKCGEKKFI